MPNIRIKDYPQTATTPALDDFVALDGETNGSRKLDASTLVTENRQVASGTGLQGGGDLTEDRTLSLTDPPQLHPP
jgi:hypothetical protein